MTLPNTIQPAPHPNGDMSKFRGLLPIPAEVEQIIAKEAATHAMTLEFRRRLAERLTLQYYFEAVDVAYRKVDQGVEVVAVGLAEIADLVKRTTPEQRRDVIFGQG